MHDIVRKVTSLADLEELKELTSGIVEERCWEAYIGYADELILQIGEKIPYTYLRLAGKEHGAWTLCSCGTNWVLEAANQTLVNSEDALETIKQEIGAIKNTKIVLFEVTYPGLALIVSFDNNCVLKVLPTLQDDAFDLAYWQLFCPPDRAVLEAGPGSKWSYT